MKNYYPSEVEVEFSTTRTSSKRNQLKVIKNITSVIAVMFFLFSSYTMDAQCTEPSCLPTAANLGANGPDPCEAKLYCSNSGAVQTGLINCTHAADTDGCGVNADAASSAASTYASADPTVVELFSGGQYNTGTYLQWIVFATPPTVEGTKIQGVGAVDSWWLFHAGSVTIPGDYTTVEEALTDPARCDSFDSSNLIIGSNANQYELWTNDDAVIGADVYNVYYIALFWDTPTNGSLNFKVKECEIGCPDLVVSCPDDVIVDCYGEVQNLGNNKLDSPINNSATNNLTTAFDNWLLEFAISGGGDMIIDTYTVDGGPPIDFSLFPQGITEPIDVCGGGSVTVVLNASDECEQMDSCSSTFTLLPMTTPPDAGPDDGNLVGCAIEATEPTPPIISDYCGNPIIPTGPSIGGTYVDCEGTITYTWIYTDCTGSSDDWTYTYTIDYTQGVTAPADEMATVECPADAVDPGAPATVQDGCGRDVVPVLIGSTSVPDPVTCEGTVVWTYRYTDCTGQGTDDWTYTYTIDIVTPPNAGTDDGSMVQCLDDAVEPLPPMGITDVCGRPIVPTGPTVNTVFDGCMGTRTYTFTYTDCSGLFDEWVYTYEIEDTIDPEIINLPVVDPLCNDGFPDELFADWIDNCADGGTISSGAPVITRDECFEEAVYTFYVEDNCGNSDTETVTVIREFDRYENCETAFGRLSPNNPPSQCFINDPDYNFNRWGWTNYIATEGTYTMELWAGAAHCDTSNGVQAGEVIVTYQGGIVDVEYDLFEGYVMSEGHIYIGCEKYPTKRNGRPTVAPGQYTFNLGSLDYANGYTLEDVEVDGPFWIIVHAVTCEEVCRCSVSNDDGGSQTSQEGLIDCTAESQPVSSTLFNQLEFDVYPVPFDSYLNVAYNFNYDTNVEIQIFDIKGMLIKQVDNNYTKGTNSTTRIDLVGVANQVLFVKVITDRGVGMKKVVSSNYIKRN